MNLLKKHKNKLKIVATSAAICLSLAVGLTATLAFFKYEETQDAKITTMKASIELIESKEEDEYGGETLVYGIRAKEDNTDYVYTRLSIQPYIEIESEDKEGEWDAYAGIPSSNIDYRVDGDDWGCDWNESGDTYYYYLKQINYGPDSVRNTTTPLKIQYVTMDTAGHDSGSGEYFELPTSIDGREIRVNFYVSAEAVQASNNAYQLNWDLTEEEFKEIGIKDLNKTPKAD